MKNSENRLFPSEIRFAVRIFVESRNNKFFIKLACSVRTGKIVVLFFFFLEVYVPRLWRNSTNMFPTNTDLTLVQ